MKQMRSFISEISDMLKMVLIFAAATSVLLLYVHLHIESAILKRQIARQTFEKEELLRRNQALQRAISDLNWQAGQKNWQSKLILPPYEKNKIVRIKLPQSVPKSVSENH